MEALLKNIWDAPASTIAGGLKIAVGTLIGTEGLNLSPLAIGLILAASGFVSFVTGPHKVQTKKK